LAEAELVAAGEVTEEQLAGVRRAAEERVEQAVRAARAAAVPADQEAYRHVFVGR
jgi:TPP-dependent pyruvate/acetoin dehydrogenase alpha subunit